MNRLKLLREEKQLTQSDIAKLLNITIAAYSYYENEKRDMTPDTILKLAEYFDVSTDYLLGKSDIRNPEKIDMNKVNVAFSSGYNGLNDTNKAIIQSTIEGLLAKQKQDQENNKKQI